MKHQFSARIGRAFPVLLTVALAAAPTFAQPQAGPNVNDNPPNQDMGGRGGNRPDRAAMQAQMVRRQLQRAGIADAGVQESVTTYLTNRQTARKPLNDAAAALTQVLENEEATDAQTEAALATYKAALNAEKARVTAAETELDGQIGFSKNSKLEAVLTLAGVIGDSQSYLDNAGGRGGFGGGGRGRGGNRGGGGGANAN